MPHPNTYDPPDTPRADWNAWGAHPVTGECERYTPRQLCAVGLSPVQGPVDFGLNYAYAFANAKVPVTGAITLGTAHIGRTLVYTGTGHALAVTGLVPVGSEGHTFSTTIRNRGTGPITLQPSGVTLIRSIDGTIGPPSLQIPAGRSASLEWEASATTAYCHVDGV